MVRPVLTRDGSTMEAPPVTSISVVTAPHLQLAFHHGLGAGGQDHSGVALPLEAFLLDRHRVGAERQVRKHVVAVVVAWPIGG